MNTAHEHAMAVWRTPNPSPAALEGAILAYTEEATARLRAELSTANCDRENLRSILAREVGQHNAARARENALRVALEKLVELWDRKDGALVSNYPHVGVKWIKGAREALTLTASADSNLATDGKTE